MGANKPLADTAPASLPPLLLLEPDALLRRTVALTARSMQCGEVHEATSIDGAMALSRMRLFKGAVLALDFNDEEGRQRSLDLMSSLRKGAFGERNGTRIAVMLDACSVELLQELKERDISRVILKPFRARILLEVLTEFAQ
jgi:ActR/RegA family two-component response regulator